MGCYVNIRKFFFIPVLCFFSIVNAGALIPECLAPTYEVLLKKYHDDPMGFMEEQFIQNYDAKLKTLIKKRKKAIYDFKQYGVIKLAITETCIIGLLGIFGLAILIGKPFAPNFANNLNKLNKDIETIENRKGNVVHIQMHINEQCAALRGTKYRVNRDGHNISLGQQQIRVNDDGRDLSLHINATKNTLQTLRSYQNQKNSLIGSRNQEKMLIAICFASAAVLLILTLLGIHRIKKTAANLKLTTDDIYACQKMASWELMNEFDEHWKFYKLITPEQYFSILDAAKKNKIASTFWRKKKTRIENCYKIVRFIRKELLKLRETELPAT